MKNKSYAEMTLDELEAENIRLWNVRQEVKAAQMELQPFLDAAWKVENEYRALQADPRLTQGIEG